MRDSDLWGRSIDRRDLYRRDDGRNDGYGIGRLPRQKLFGVRVYSFVLERAGKMILEGGNPPDVARSCHMDLVTLLRFCDSAGLPLPPYYSLQTWGRPKTNPAPER